MSPSAKPYAIKKITKTYKSAAARAFTLCQGLPTRMSCKLLFDAKIVPIAYAMLIMQSHSFIKLKYFSKIPAIATRQARMPISLATIILRFRYAT